jgi:hypothetical protein
MKELSDPERGILIFMIEEYFKSTHNFRGISEVNDLSKNKNLITPYSFIDFANNFDLNNLLANRKIIHKNPISSRTNQIGHTGIHSENNTKLYSLDESFSKIPNTGFPEVDEDLIITNTLKGYITPEELAELRSIDKKGDEFEFGKNNLSELTDKLKKIAKKFNTAKCNTVWNNNKNSWFFINFFPSSYYKQKGYLNGKRFLPPSLKLKEYVILEHEPFIRIFSNQKEGCSIKTIGKNNNFKMGGTVFNYSQSTQGSSFGNINKLRLINHYIRYLTS